MLKDFDSLRICNFSHKPVNFSRFDGLTVEKIAGCFRLMLPYHS